jgi:hypothetical protein
LPREIAPTELTFLGTVNGMPVYAERAQVLDVQEKLTALKSAQSDNDLGRTMTQHKDVRDALADVNVYYVPLQPTGCVFQAVTAQQQIRKKEPPLP